MGVLYVVAGIGHLMTTRFFESSVPDYPPAHHVLVLASGDDG
jgi:uncharacterized membrane protein